MAIPTPPASETPSIKAKKIPRGSPPDGSSKNSHINNAGRRRPQVAPRPQDADVLAHAEPLLREGAPGRRPQKIRADVDQKRAVGLPPARRPGEEEEGALEEAVSLFSTTEEGAPAARAARAFTGPTGTSVVLGGRRGGPGQE